ncbi:MAG: nucleotidyltransferase family protein [Candidatus Bathyarchaeia archaeon]
MKAVILAGGQGKRLKPLTDSIPKPLIEVAGKPIIVHQMEWLKRYGVDEFIVTIGYLKDRFIETLGSGRKYGVHVSYVVEEEPLGTGGGLKNAEPLLKNEGFFYVVNGDVLTDIDPRRLLEACDGGFTGVIALVPLPSPYGLVVSDDKGVVELFQEKPVIQGHWINAGIYLFKPEVFKYLPDRGDLERTLFPRLAEEGRLRAVKYQSPVFWRSIDTWKDLEEVEAVLKETCFER